MTTALLLGVFSLHALVIAIDEFYFHRRRGLPKWERWGHPLDTLTLIACLVFVRFVPYSGSSLITFVMLAIFSCLFVTKDEWVHTKFCTAGENWVHAVLFLLHPVIMGALALMWPFVEQAGFLRTLSVLIVIVGTYCAYQIIYWNFLWIPKESQIAPRSTTLFTTR